MGRPILKNDLVGQRIGRWTVLGYSHHCGKHSYFLCRCECGTERAVLRYSLTSGKSYSCGCFTKEVNSARPLGLLTHGLSGTPEYMVWCGIKRRCENPNEKSYPRYGGAGIQCLFGSFVDFLSEVGPRPTDNHSIDRIRTDRHYEPGNVRWATASDQARNKNGTLRATVGGETKPLADWCEIFGQPYKRVWQRIQRDDWPIERALRLGAQR